MNKGQAMNNDYAFWKSQQPKKNQPLRFTEKHLIESLNVNAMQARMPVMFYNMLNQGNKRGKETQVLSLDCERILTDQGERLARVSIVNYYGNIVFDTLVKPCISHEEDFRVVDYREWITGIKPIDLEYAPSFGNIEPIIKKIVKDKVIVGHSLKDDLKILNIDLEESNIQIRDVSNIELFMKKIDKDSKSPIKLLEDELKSPSKLKKTLNLTSKPISRDVQE
jgi:RNA exonuclease 4